jgi:hypothetical protein
MGLTPPQRQGIFQSLLGKFRLETKGALAEPEPWLFELFAGDASPSLAGITVSPRTAMACAPVRCAVQAIAETIGQLPVQVYRYRIARRGGYALLTLYSTSCAHPFRFSHETDGRTGVKALWLWPQLHF